MTRYMTVKDLKDDINGWHENWDDWLILINDERVEHGDFDIQVTTSDEFDEDEDDG